MIPAYPRATMRVQLSTAMRFADLTAIVPYFAELGISHLYTSPILAARAGSTHGYDIVDHNRLNPELGDEDDLRGLVETLHRHDMGLIVDFVPNHMGVGFSDNAWWLNVLEWGQYSPYASFFDIDWKPSEQTLRGKVLIPVLGDQYGAILERGELVLEYRGDHGDFSVRYYEHRFPISPRHYHTLLSDLAERVSGESAHSIRELADAFRSLGPGARSARRQAMLIRRADELRASLAHLVHDHSEVKRGITELCAAWNGTIGDDRSFDRLHQLLEKQAYRLAYWRLASNEINYRRFFDINDLAAVRMELPDVFEITHQLIFRYVQDGWIQGLRLDHVDGLLDPKGYLNRLQEAAAYRMLGRRSLSDDSVSSEPIGASINEPLYVVVEKILARHESLRPEWPVAGTTGYDHMARIAELLFDPDGESGITTSYERYVGAPRNFESEVFRAKYRTMQETLASELNVLANRLSRLAKRSRKTRDLSRLALRSALSDIVARFPVYRSYVDADGPTDDDRRDIEWAVASARKAATTVDTSAYDFIHHVLTTEVLQRYPGSFRRREVVELAMKVQQFTAPVMAKSFEDTAFYRDARFIARNEVGAEPDSLYTSPQGFHYAAANRRDHHPFGMVATATHDHKRGEDVRARLAVLSEIPEGWAEWTARFAEYTAGSVTDHDGAPAPDRNDQLFLFQTIIGTWPPELDGPDYEGAEEFRERITRYAVKALREAKVHTSWTAVNEEYEAAVERYLESVMSPKRSPTIFRFIHDVVATIAPAGAANGLVQKFLTLTVPGVPDLYQGTEYWDHSLVDPDNRRPVDFTARRTSLESVRDARSDDTDRLDDLITSWRDGRVKQYVVHRVLAFRRLHPELFSDGSYLPLEVTGTQAHRVVAFLRETATERVVVVAARFLYPVLVPDAGASDDAVRDAGGATLGGDAAFWGDTRLELPDSRNDSFRDIISHSTITTVRSRDTTTLRVADALTRLPVALLHEDGR